MKVIAVIIVVFWWIAIWGIFDILTEHKSKYEKMEIYTAIIVTIIIIIIIFPHMLDHIC
jgi:hypothetical protein